MQLKNTWTIWKILRTTSREWWFWTLSKTIQKCFIKIIINDFFMVKNDFHFVDQNTVRFGSTFASHISLRSVNFYNCLIWSPCTRLPIWLIWAHIIWADQKSKFSKLFDYIEHLTSTYKTRFNLLKNCFHFTILLLHETFMPWILSSLMRFEWSKVMWNLLSKTSVFKLYRVRIEFYYLIQFLIELKMKLGFGLIAFAAASKQYIIGGYEPSPNSEKYIVSLQRGGSHFCGGTVISSSKSLSF